MTSVYNDLGTIYNGMSQTDKATIFTGVLIEKSRNRHIISEQEGRYRSLILNKILIL
jgi:hypothetical protein